MRLKVDIIVEAGAQRDDPHGQECDQDDPHCYKIGYGSDPVEAGSLKALPVLAETSRG